MCKCMKVSRNAYYHWLKTKDNIIEIASLTLLKKRIRVIFEQSRQIYGSHRVQKMIEKEGLVYSRLYIALLMRKIGLRSVLRRKYVITTDFNHSAFYTLFGSVSEKVYNKMYYPALFMRFILNSFEASSPVAVL